MPNQMTTKQLRQILAVAIVKAGKGALPYQDAKSLIGLANQISNNMSAEVKVREQELRIHSKAPDFGTLEI